MNDEMLSERLRLRRGRPGDLEKFAALNGDGMVMRYISGHAFEPGSAESDATAKRHFTMAKRDDGLGIWLLEWRHKPGFLGWAGLFELPGSDKIEVGYRLSRAAWGQGVATEAARRLIVYGFDEKSLPLICAVTHQENQASKRVLKKAGLNYLGLRRNYNLELTYFELTEADYRAGLTG